VTAFPRRTPLHTDASGAAHPDAFGPFRVLHQVGAGTLGPVFRAYDPDRDRLVAVKLLRVDLTPERMHQLLAGLERLIAAELVHPVIVAPVAAGTDGVILYLAQEYVAPESLDVIVRDHGPVPPDRVLGIVNQLAGALEFAACANIHHGALHPRDLLISQTETRVTGLGMAQALEQVGVTAPIRRPYTAPERVASLPWSRQADIFSLAAITYEMLSGKRVTSAAGLATLDLTMVPGPVQEPLRAVFTRALADHPSDRFATALEFGAALRAAFSETDLAAPEAHIPVPVMDAEPKWVEPTLPLYDAPLAAERGAQTIALEKQPADLEIRAAEAVRYVQADTGGLDEFPSLPSPTRHPVSSKSAFGSTDRDSESLDLMSGSREMGLGPSRKSPSWPLAAGALVALALAFLGGYALGRQSARTTVVATAPPPRPQPSPKSAPTPAPVLQPKRDEVARVSPPQPTPRPAPPVAVQPVTGRLLVRSTPAGARVLVDGRDEGVTPAVVRNLSQGTHAIRVTAAGFTPEERRVTITPSQLAQSITVELDRAQSSRRSLSREVVQTSSYFSGALRVESLPPGANVFLDGKPVGTTPLSLSQVSAGSHVLRLEHEGYQRWTSAISVASGDSRRVTASLER
jgi:serine/threonine protein kinase